MEDLFCQKCGSLMSIDKEKKKSRCNNCGYSPRGKVSNVILKEKVALRKDQEIELVEKNLETMPKTGAECSKCGHSKAYYWTVQTRSADEGETRFFECCKCKHRWREF